MLIRWGFSLSKREKFHIFSFLYICCVKAKPLLKMDFLLVESKSISASTVDTMV
jgi:hypothetical protein